MLWREIKIWVLSLYTNLILGLELTDKSEGGKGVLWDSEMIIVSRLATKLTKTEDVQMGLAFLTKLQFSSLTSCD